jgi:hypothetical protein
MYSISYNLMTEFSPIEDDIRALADVLPLHALDDVLQTLSPDQQRKISVRALQEGIRASGIDVHAQVANAARGLLATKAMTEAPIFEQLLDGLQGENNPLHADINGIVQEILRAASACAKDA